MPIRRLDDRQPHLPFKREFVDILYTILKAPRPRKEQPSVIERIVYRADSTTEMLADGHKARGDSYRMLVIKTFKFTKRLLSDAAEAMAADDFIEFDMDFEELSDELEELTESYDREESRSHKEQQRELSKKRSFTAGKPSASPAARHRPF